ncbi:TolB family protein [Candidatus Uabimicrobium sp. HlEnr_7]|uniref:TolB family protein n=1 Tax=Candidatus Uabimicrobium helgolandensis TaxID=3095367 RepID=UPI0035590687
MKWIYIFIVCSFCYTQTDTEIYLFDLQKVEIVHRLSDGTHQIENSYILENGKNITNRNGYDNQPYFSLDSKHVYYSSIRGEKNSDIYRYSLVNNSTQQITTSEEAEYSPTILNDKNDFSVVRVENDKKQRMWKFSEGKAQVVAEQIDQIGYHCWLDNTTIAVFRIEKTMNLKLIDVKDGKMQHATNNIGRALFLNPNDNKLLFVNKENEKQFTICKLLNYKEKISIEKITDVVGKGEDFACTITGKIIMASGNKVYIRQQHKWSLIFDGKNEFQGTFNRIAISPDNTKICIVFEKNIPKETN